MPTNNYYLQSQSQLHVRVIVTKIVIKILGKCPSILYALKDIIIKVHDSFTIEILNYYRECAVCD